MGRDRKGEARGLGIDFNLLWARSIRLLHQVEERVVNSITSDLTAHEPRCSLLQLIIGRSIRQELSPALFGTWAGCGRFQKLL